MAVPTVEEEPHDDEGTRDFLENSYLTYVAPLATNFNVETALSKESHGSHKAAFESIERREWLFFDETVDIYLILRTPYQEKSMLKSYLRRLDVNLEAQIVNSHASDREAPPAAEIIYNGSVPGAGDGFVLEDDIEGGNEDDSPERHTYVIWKLSVFLARPRIRLQGPSVVFSGTATLRRQFPEPAKLLRDGYLESLMPSGLNLLESFGDDPAMGGIKPRLSALRVSRVAPVTQPRDGSAPLQGLAGLRFKIYPAVHTRVRFARPNTAPPSPAMIAMLEVDFTPFFDCEVSIDAIHMAVTHGVVEDLSDVQGLGLPLSCVAHDHVTFVYRLGPPELDFVTKAPGGDLDIAIEVTAHVRPGVCLPRLKMSWTTALDFGLPVNPGFGTAVTQPIQRAHRPSQLSIGGNADAEAQSLISPSVRRPDALPVLEAAVAAHSTEASLPEMGITMTFTGPSHAVYPGTEFSWSVLVVNRARHLPNAPSPPPRKLALLAIPRRRRATDVRAARPTSSAPHGAGHAVTEAAVEAIADAVVDENVVHAMQRSGSVEGADVVCLSADIRVGPLAPNACHVVDLRFLALHEGIAAIEAVRVVDVATQDHVDVRELPIIVVEKGKNSRE